MESLPTISRTTALPARLERLEDLALNLRWAWHPETVELFRRLGAGLWEASGHNPVHLLGALLPEALEAAAADDDFVARLDHLAADLDRYLETPGRTWEAADGAPPLVAYFSAEFGITECLPIFSGGLGILAGDHLKSASDLGLPLVGVGLMYRRGYFRQSLGGDGRQHEAYPVADFGALPIVPEVDLDGAPLTVTVAFPGRAAVARVWRAQVGRVPLYLLDTDLAENDPEDREVTSRLYSGDLEMRIRQELVLGFGGYRALEALGLSPTVYHMNEGHAAFLALEHVRRLTASGLEFEAAREAASASLVFTTHTPVPAGHDYFPPPLMRHYLGAYPDSVGLEEDEFLGLGRKDPDDGAEPFCMTVLALRLAAQSNGVSRLHGDVSRRMWQVLWPDVPEDEVPIGHVTNGIHAPSWISPEIEGLCRGAPGGSSDIAAAVAAVPDEELWRIRCGARARLVAFARTAHAAQHERAGASRAEVEAAGGVLEPGALTIGFARRFTAYKRATLLLRDPARLWRLLNHPERPVQLVFAGKAHPKDEEGKELIRRIVELSHRDGYRGRLVFLENYDIAVARRLVHGVDVWLNTPRRPLEASGTSGMKAAVNGVLNLSVLDGWWAEAWEARQRTAPEGAPIGWAIGQGETFGSTEEQDRADAEALYALLETDVVPAFYRRDGAGIPRQWVARMRASICALASVFNTDRMVAEYAERLYLPQTARARRLAAREFALARSLGGWMERVREDWPQVRVQELLAEPATEDGGAVWELRAWVWLGALSPSDVRLEVYIAAGEPAAGGARLEPMDFTGPARDGGFVYKSRVTVGQEHPEGFNVRVLPSHPELGPSHLPGLITWAAPEA